MPFATRTALRALVVAIVAFAAVVPASASTAPPRVAMAKKCKRGYKRVKVRRHGKVHFVCKRKRPPAPTATPAPATTPVAQPAPQQTPAAPVDPGPAVADVEDAIRASLQANHLPALPPESIEVTFEQPTLVLSKVSYDPYANDPLHAGGAIDAWPVRAWVKYVNNHDATPADDTHYGGCDGHLDAVWPHDMLYMFFRDATGAWSFKGTNAKPGDCG